METDDRTWVAGKPFSSKESFFGRLSLVGGTLILTSDRVTFKPIGGMGRSKKFLLTDLTAVDSLGDKPPRLRITSRDGDSLVIMVGSSRSDSMSSQDTSARDEAVAAITAAAGLTEAVGPIEDRGDEIGEQPTFSAATPDAPAPEVKKCPDCAEMVLAEARKCKHCGYRFDDSAAAS
jgi:hypothetical protein